MEHNKPKPLTMLRGRGASAFLRTPAYKFWLSSPDEFPWATGHVFLAIATNQIARAMFGDEWSGTEPTIRRPGYNLPDRLEVQRFDKVKRKIAQLAANGVLETMWRHTDGGKLWPIDPSAWQTERLDNRFYCCQMNLRDPFSQGFAGKDYGYIFVAEASLARSLKELAPAGPKPARKGRRKGSTKYPWPDFHREAIRKLDEEGGIDLASDPQFNQAALINYMADWCGENWESVPSTEMIRQHTVQAIEMHRQNKK